MSYCMVMCMIFRSCHEKNCYWIWFFIRSNFMWLSEYPVFMIHLSFVICLSWFWNYRFSRFFNLINNIISQQQLTCPSCDMHSKRSHHPTTPPPRRPSSLSHARSSTRSTQRPRSSPTLELFRARVLYIQDGAQLI